MYDNPINTTLNTKPNKKRIKLIVTITIVIFTLLIVTFILLFTVTDIFKTDKELFFKTVSQISDKKDGFIDDKITQYFEKKKTTPYENQGSYTVNMSQGNEQSQQVFDKFNNINIEFSGKTDNPNSNSQQEIKLNYSNEVSIPLNYKKIGSIVGIQADYLSTNYIAFDISKLGEFLGINIDLEKTLQVEFTEEEKKHISEVFASVLNEQLSKDKFSKTKGMEETGYKLTLTLGEIKNIYIQLLEKIKDDQIILNKINEISSNNNGAQITSEDIQKIIDSYANNIEEEANDIKIEIIAYSKNKKLSKISINVSKDTMQGNIEISKNQDDNCERYICSLNASNKTNSLQIDFSVEYTGLQQMQNVEESYQAGYNMTQDGNTQLEGTYTISDNVNFSEEAANIEDFDKPNTILLSNHEKEQVYEFLGKVGERFEQVNEQAVNQAELADLGNPVMFMIPFVVPVELSTVQQNNTILQKSTDARIENYRGEVCDRINIALNASYSEILMSKDLSTLDKDKIIKDNGLEDSMGYGTYDVEITDKELKITWTPSNEEYGDKIEGSIESSGNNEGVYRINPATLQ